MANTSNHRKGQSTLALGLGAALSLAVLTAAQPARADYNGSHHRPERQHATPYRDHDRGEHRGWHHRHHFYQPRCTTRAVPYWDSFWGQWRTNYVRECW